MYKQEIKYTNFNGEEQKAIAWFNLNRREVLDIATQYAPRSADLEEVAKVITDGGDLHKQFKFIDNVILSAYGERDADGITFKKSPEIRENFANSVIYDALFNTLLTDEATMRAFIDGVPQDQSKNKPLSQAPRA